MLIYHLKKLDEFNAKIVVQKQTWNNAIVFPEHKHDYIEVIYAIQGNGTNIIDRFAYPAIQGDLYIIKQGSVHSFYSYSQLSVYNLIFSLSLFSPAELRLLNENDNFKEIFTHSEKNKPKFNKIRLTPVQDSMIGACFAQLYQELNQRKKGYQILCKSILVMLLTQISRIGAETASAQKEQRTYDNSNTLSKILDYINHHYLEEITREKIAAIGHLNKNYVSEFFHKHTGTPLLKYINTLRIENARKLLVSRPDLNIGEIAYRSGFTDTCYFTRLFHSMCGCSPSAFRKKSNKDSAFSNTE